MTNRVSKYLLNKYCMLIFTPVDLPRIEPDDWDIFWDIWNKHNKPLVKIKKNTELSTAEVGSDNIWNGIDIFDKYHSTMPTDTNWFMYNDKHCWHGTDFDPTNKKILLQAFCLDPNLNDLIDRSISKYK